MKRSLLVLFGTLLLAGCGSESAKQADQEETPEIEQTEDQTIDEQEIEGEVLSATEIFEETEELGEVVESSESTNHDNLMDLPEFETLGDNINLASYVNFVKTDNKGNRVILFMNEQGHPQYKSVFVKYKNRLKIVDLPNDQLVFNEAIQTTDVDADDSHVENKNHETSTPDNATNDAIQNLPEFDKIAEHIDLEIYSGTVQTDNKGNRVLTFADANGQKKYKSIFVKRDNRLKIVHFDNDDLIFNEII